MDRTPAPARADATAIAATVERTAGQGAAARQAGCESARPPCRFFLLGKCKFGSSCTFSHDPADGRVPVCSFFERTGTCRYGDDCKFLHGGGTDDHQRPASTTETTTMTTTTTSYPAAAAAAAAGEAAAAAAEVAQQEQYPEAGRASPRAAKSPEAAGGGGKSVKGDDAAAAAAAGGEEMECTGDKCGICLENIPASGKRFGLLNCDHVYCLECLRTWRKSRGPQKDISRTCPECRKVSFFLVPSKEHLKGKEKLKAIQAYKKGLSKLPCKYHKPESSRGSGSGNVNICPFGARCFYAHLDEHGNDVKDKTPPAASAPMRRTCPYLAGRGGGGGGGGGGGSGRASRGSGRRGGRSGGRTGGSGGDSGLGVGHSGHAVGRLGSFDRPFLSSDRDAWMAQLIPDSVNYQQHADYPDVGGQDEHVSIIRRLQQLMLGTADDDY
ncbi:unnamed protein product [Scytosiphon promiscuus]